MDIQQSLTEYLVSFVSENKQNLFQKALQNRTEHISLYLEGVENPCDAAAVMRSCECFGVQQMHLFQPAAHDKRGRGVSVGASKWLTLKRYREGDPSLKERTLQGLKDQGKKLFLLDQKAESTMEDLDLNQPFTLCLAIGEPSETLRLAADQRFALPTVGFTGSFNISITAALSLYGLREQLRLRNVDISLSEKEKQRRLLVWSTLLPKRRKLLVERFLQENQLSFEDLKGFPREFFDLLGMS